MCNIECGQETILTNGIIFWDVTPCGLLVATDVSEEHIASIFRVEEIISPRTSK
jgi:hypothetical protein